MSAKFTDEFSIHRKYYDTKDPRLGRHVHHDERSRSFAFTAVDRSTLVSKQHVSNVPVFDQGSLGSCTGNSSVKSLSYLPLWNAAVSAVLSTTDAAADEKVAVSVYSDATKIDDCQGTYPPTDTGSNGVSVAKVLQKRGLIAGYQHAFSLDALLTALQTQPVIVGSDWTADMFNPAADGQIRPTGEVQGGHEYCLDQIDVENKRVWVQNSWGESWGLKGRAWISWDDMTALLKANGDCTIFTPLSSTPAPVPVPASRRRCRFGRLVKKLFS